MPIGHLVCLAGRTLREPIVYEIEVGGIPGVRLWCETFFVWGSGETFADALDELTSALVATWEDYLISPDDSLTPLAQVEKQRLRWLMGDISLNS